MAWQPIGVSFVLWGAMIGCKGGDSDTEVPVDTTAASDYDGDGVSGAQGDCNDGDPTIYPGAPELTGDTVDQNCDGSLFEATRVADVGRRWDGTEPGMALGGNLRVVSASDLPGVLLASGTADGVGEHGGDGAVYVFSAAELSAGDPSGTLLHDVDEGNSFGRGIGTTRLATGERVWLAGFNEGTRYAGFCAWDEANTGIVAVSGALACPPPFASANDRASYSFTDGVDVDNNGGLDLVIAGTADVAGERTGALWVADGPVTAASLAVAPRVALTGFTSIPTVFPAGDFDDDGVEDFAIADSGASGEVTAAGVVYLAPGNAAWPTPVAGWTKVAGARQDSNTGRSVVALYLNDDAFVDLCLGSPLDETAGDHGGRVGCFFGPIDGDKTLDDADVTWLAERPNLMFGESLAAFDVDGDGTDELVVGAPGDGYLGQVYPGKVYVLSVRSADPIGVFVGEVGDRFGTRVGTGDIDGDGLPELAVGAPGAGNTAGAVYVVFGDAGAW